MKPNIQIAGGSASLATGLILFLYYGTRERPVAGQADAETQREAFLNDIATFGGLGLILLGVVLLLLGASVRWNRRSDDSA